MFSGPRLGCCRHRRKKKADVVKRRHPALCLYGPVRQQPVLWFLNSTAGCWNRHLLKRSFSIACRWPIRPPVGCGLPCGRAIYPLASRFELRDPNRLLVCLQQERHPNRKRRTFRWASTPPNVPTLDDRQTRKRFRDHEISIDAR